MSGVAAIDAGSGRKTKMKKSAPTTTPDSRREKLEGLSLLESENDILEGVKKIAVTFGKVHSVIPISPTNNDGDTEYVYTINFESTLDAMTAARELRGFLYGFSALVIKIRKSGDSRQPSQQPPQ